MRIYQKTIEYANGFNSEHEPTMECIRRTCWWTTGGWGGCFSWWWPWGLEVWLWAWAPTLSWFPPFDSKLENSLAWWALDAAPPSAPSSPCALHADVLEEAARQRLDQRSPPAEKKLSGLKGMLNFVVDANFVSMGFVATIKVISFPFAESEACSWLGGDWHFKAPFEIYFIVFYCCLSWNVVTARHSGTPWKGNYLHSIIYHHAFLTSRLRDSRLPRYWSNWTLRSRPIMFLQIGVEMKWADIVWKY